MVSSLLFRLLCLIFSVLACIDLTACSKDSINVPSPALSSNKLPVIFPQNIADNTPPRIALLVPLQGPLATIGQAVKQGFLAAATQTNTSQIIVIDTCTESSIQAAYNRALQQKAQFVVGPLLKPQIQTLASLELSTPILALNYLNSDISTPPQLYQFGLSPLDEAQQATLRAWQRGYRSALIMTSDDHWGSQIGQAFAHQWQVLGGKVVGQLALSKNSSATTRQIRQLLQFKPPHERRSDFDVIFLASSPQIGRQVKPLLKFFYAGDIPVYATASIYNPCSPRRLNQDLDQITFCAAPWELGIKASDTHLYEALKASSPQHFRCNSQYYALGVDAFQLAQHLSLLTPFPDQTLPGATGELSLTNQHRITRQLPCAQFHNGHVQLTH